MEPFDTIDRIRSEGQPLPQDIQALRTLTTEYPQEPQLWVCLGDMMLLSKSHYAIQASVDCYHRAIECDPDFADAYEELGWVHDTYADDFANAERYFRLALEKGGGDSCHVGLARIYAQLGKSEAATQELNQCADQDRIDVKDMRRDIAENSWHK